MGIVTAVLIAATIYLFIHAATPVFLAWCGFVPTVTGVYHWLTVRDSKEKDQC